MQVDWYPWGTEAFDKAKAEDKPIFLSVGYSTCRWCALAHASLSTIGRRVVRVHKSLSPFHIAAAATARHQEETEDIATLSTSLQQAISA